MTAAGDESTRLIVIRGNSGSGKSALAAAIRQARPRGIAIIGHDQLRREILHVPDRPGALSVDYIELSARFALDHGLHVIIEGILHREIYGAMLRRLLHDHRGISRCYRYDLPFEETLRRHRTKDLDEVVRRTAAKGRKPEEVGPDLLRSWWRDHDPLDGIEETIIGPHSELADSVHLVIEDCGWLAEPADPRPGSGR